MSPGALAAAVAVFILGFASAIALYRARFSGERLRVDRLLEPSYRTEANSAAILRGSANADGFGAGWLDAMARRQNKSSVRTSSQKQIDATLSHAGFNGPNKLVIFRLVRLTSVVVAGILGFVLGALTGRLALQIALFLAAFGYMLPVRILRRRATKRQGKVIKDLPATLDLLTVCLEAGLGLAEALRLVARRAERRGGVLGADLAILTGELNAGLPLATALNNLAERVGTEDLKSVCSLLIQSDEMGTQLAPALRASVEQFGARRRMRAEERAQKAAVKMLIPLAVLILPAMLIVVLGPALLQILSVVGGK